MFEKKIARIAPEIGVDGDKLKEVNNAFISKEVLKDEDITWMADSIASAIKEKTSLLKDTNQAIEFIVSVLDPSQIMNSVREIAKNGFTVGKSIKLGEIKLSWIDAKGDTQSDTISREELSPLLHKIRMAVLQKLQAILPPDIGAQIVKIDYIKRSELEGGSFYKNPVFEIYPENSKPEIEGPVQALKYLHSLPERSPFIYYGTETIDPENANTISNKINLDTLDGITYRKEKIPFKKILRYFTDILEGHEFLLSHGLMLSDNALVNLGINNSTDKGILFDFDGLRRQGDKTAYVSHYVYSPPERSTNPEPITEANIVYELGVGLGQIVAIYKSKEGLAEQTEDLGILYRSMIEEKPNRRPTLSSVKEKLKEIEGSL